MKFKIGEEVLVNDCFTKNEICTVRNIKYELEDDSHVFVLENNNTNEYFESDGSTMAKLH